MRGTTRAAFFTASALLLLGAAVFGQQRLGRPTLAIRGGTVITGVPGRVLEHHVVVLAGDRILLVCPEDQVDLPPEVEILDARGRFVIPGLFDAHVHLASTQTPLGVVPEEIQKLLDAFLLNGVTSILDLWATDEIFLVREALRRGEVEGPRLFASGSGLSAPGSHGTQFGYAQPRIVTPAEARARVRALAALRADIIKAALDPVRRDGRIEPSMSRETFRALVEEAHAHGLKVAVHALPAPLALAALEEGADVLAHVHQGRKGAEKVVEAARARRAAVIPCLVVEEPLVRLRRDPTFLRAEQLRASVDPRVLAGFQHLDLRRLNGSVFARAARTWPVALENARALVRAGATVLGGSDAGNLAVFHGPSLHREAELLVRAGMSTEDVLGAVTAGGARLLGLEHEQGTIAAGRLADLVILDANPLADIRNLRRVRAVVKGGRVVDREALRARIRSTLSRRPAKALFADFGNERPVTLTGSLFTGVVESGPGPHSRVQLQVLREEGRDFLRVQGEVGRSLWARAGVLAHIWPFGLEAGELSELPQISFEARGDGGRCLLEVLTLDSGEGAYVRAFLAPREWTSLSFDLRTLRSDGVPGRHPLDPGRVLALRFVTATGRKGAFSLDLDTIRFAAAGGRTP